MTSRQTAVLHQMTHSTWRLYAWVGLLSALLAWGIYAYIIQWRQGLTVTGLRDQVSWGLYISNFVFWVGVSKGGTMISAIFRLTGAEWRRPVTRMAEAITVLALITGVPMIVADLGRPDRMLNLVWYGRIQSPLIWDFLSVTTYLTACILYFYLPLIPDVAMLSERTEFAPWRRRLYRLLSLGWKGSPEQHALLERAITVMAIAVIPLAISVHTVVSWIFAMTLRPGWNSSIYGPYFVVGAIYSGTGAVILSMWALRRTMRLERYVQPVHFRKLGIVLLVSTLLYLYFNINEYLTAGYKLESFERELLESLFAGRFAPMFWSVQIVGIMLPIVLLSVVLAFKRLARFTVPIVATSALLVVIGAWVKRFLIVVPTLQNPFLPAQRVPADWTHYQPTWVEWAIVTGAFAAFLLAYTLLVKLFPVVSFWETEEGGNAVADVTTASAAPSRPRLAVKVSALLLVAALGTVHARTASADPAPAQPKSTTLTLSFTAAPAAPTQLADSPGVRLKLGPDGGHHLRGPAEPTYALMVVARLTGPDGTPAPFKPISFSAKTTFGVVQYGSRPTDATGSVRLTITDRRFGSYAVRAVYAGDDEFAASQTDLTVTAAPRPPSELPKEGMLISPTATLWISLPFLLFFGAMWIAFAYSFGYLVLWRMRRAAVADLPGFFEPVVTGE